VASRLGQAAVEVLLEGKYGLMVGIESGKVSTYPLSYAWEHKKSIDPDLMRLAEILAS